MLWICQNGFEHGFISAAGAGIIDRALQLPFESFVALAGVRSHILADMSKVCAQQMRAILSKERN